VQGLLRRALREGGGFKHKEKQLTLKSIERTPSKANPQEVQVGVDFHDVALVGFAPSERATFETFFRLVSSRRPKPFRAVDKVEAAHVVFIDAGKDYRLIEIADRLKDNQVLVTFGSVRSPRSARHLDRPINLNAVLLTLDASVTATQAGANPAVSQAAPVASPAPIVPTARPNAVVATPRPLPVAPPATPAASVMPPLRIEPVFSAPPPPYRAPTAAPVLAERPPVVSSKPAAPLITSARVAPSMSPPTVAKTHASPTSATVTSLPLARPVAAPPAVVPPVVVAPPPTDGVRILVVDDSDVALKFIHNRLSAFGFNVDQCTSGEEALVRVSDGDYAFVFLDVMMVGLDGYQTCKAIKGRRYPGGRAPAVVMLTSRGGTIDKVRGTFAGCDAYLTKPLDEVKMLKVLLKHDPNLADSISTLASPSPSLPRAASAPGVNPLAASFETLSDRAQR
jgi:CheY-like chemotaxis protein